MATFDSGLLRLLVCPLSKAELVLHNGLLVSKDKGTRRAYSIVEGIPDLLIDHSLVLELADWEAIMNAKDQP